MSLNRREFLQIWWLLVWWLSVYQLSWFSLSKNDLEETKDISWANNIPAFLKNRVDFLLDNDAITLFNETVHWIDDSINISWARNSKLYWNTLNIKQNLTYKDIPELIKSIQKWSQSIEKTKNISQKYKQKSLILLNYSRQVNDKNKKELLNLISFHYFYVSCLYEWITNNEQILKYFNELALNTDNVETFNKNYEKEVGILLGEFIDNQTKNNFVLSDEKKKVFEENFAKEPNNWLKLYIDELEKFINNNYEDKKHILQFLKEIIITTFKTSEILWKIDNISERKKVFWEIYLKTQEYFKTEINDNSLVQNFQQDIQKEIKRDFESTLYYMMMDDFLLKNELQKTAIESFKNFQENLVFNDYLWAISIKISKEKKDLYYWLKKELIESKSLLDLNFINKFKIFFPKDIWSDILDFYNFLNSKDFLKIKNILTNWDFTQLKSELAKITWKNKKFILFILTSVSWYNINLVSKWSSVLEWNYSATNFEISNLKKRNSKYNCMTISALNNYVIEELFWLKWLWANFLKYKWKATNHQTNVIDVWIGELLICDVTNDRYFFIKVDEIDFDNTFDVDNYANSYMTAAYFNIHWKYVKKYFSNPFYAVYSELTWKKYFEYIMSIQESWKHNKYTLINRKNMYNNMK